MAADNGSIEFMEIYASSLYHGQDDSMNKSALVFFFDFNLKYFT